MPNPDLFREEDLLPALEGLTPLPKPADTDSMALWEQYYANQINIKNTAEGALNGFVDALCARVGLTLSLIHI